MHAERDVAAQIEALRREVAQLAEAQRRRDELMAEMMPVFKQATAVAVERLAGLDEKGYFRFGNALLEVLDRVVTSYTPDDVLRLADNIVGILDLVRMLTGPDVLRIASEMSEATTSVDSIEPVGVIGMMKASQDEDAQRGMAILLDALRRLGKGVRKIEHRQRLESHVGSRRRQQFAPMRPASSAARQRYAPPERRAEARATEPVTAPVSSTILPGVAVTADGFLVDAGQWTHDVAERLATSLGVTLTERHWQLIEFARTEFARTGASPNIRRLTLGSGIPTKELYQMFPKAPGKCTAQIAGLPKPVGCI